MIIKIIEASLRQRAVILLVAAALVLLGLWSAARLPIDAVPDITSPQVQINTEVSALAPEEIEKLVTFTLEMELSGVPGMTEMRSLSKFGLSQVTLLFADNTDIYRARQLVSERIQVAKDRLPAGLQPELAPITTGLGEIYYYIIDYAPDAKNKPPTRREQLMELKQIHDFSVKPLLRSVPGIAEINSTGGYDKQLVVHPDPEKLREANLSFDQLATILAANVENAGGGVVNRGTDQLIVRSVGRVQTVEEIANIPLKFGAGVKPILVKDLAEVAIGSAIRTGAATENGEEALLGTAMMLAGENSRLVAKRVTERLHEIRDKLPPGIVIRPVYDRAEVVDRTIATVEKNLFEGAILVVTVLFVLLGNWRAAVIVALAIPLSFLFAMTGMVEGKISGNLMSLGAIDFGLITDGAVVMVENIVRQLGLKQQSLDRKLSLQERLETVREASRQVANPMFFGVLIITIVYVPILGLTGIEGKMFHPMAMTVMLCLSGALVMALTVMPVLSSFVLGSGRIREGDNRVMSILKHIYLPVLKWALRGRWLIVFGAVALLVIALFVFKGLGAVFVPKLDEGSFAAVISKANSMNLDASLETEIKSEKVLLEKVPEVIRLFSHIGTSDVATDPMPVSANDLYISYKPRAEWRMMDGHRMTKDELAQTIVKEIDEEAPGQSILVEQPIEERFNELIEGVRADISVKIFGEDYDFLEKTAAQVKEILEKIPGAGEVEFEASGRVPMLEARVNRDALVKYNLHTEDLNKAIATALGGRTVGFVIEGNRRYDIVVRLAERVRENLNELRNLPVRVGDTGMLPLHEVAELKTVESVEPIRRDSGQRRAAIMVNLRGRDVESFVREAEAKVKAAVKLPEGYTIEFGGQFEHLREARARLTVLVPLTLAVIFILVFTAFRSLRQTLIIYSGVPLAATGGVFALWLCGMPFSISAAVGFIALSGVAVLDGLVMLSYFNQLRASGKNLRDAVIEGSLTRLRPILMTDLVASLGFVPMAIATGPGAEVQRPLAIVVIGGLLTSTFLKLVLLPVLYQWVEAKNDQAIRTQ